MHTSNKIAVVTGAGGGIGRAITLSLAKENIDVVLFGGNNIEKLKETEKEVLSFGVNCHVFPCDLTNDDALNIAFDKMIAKIGGFDILINNAGMTFSGKLEDTPIDVYDKLMKINARTPFILCQKSTPYLRKSNCATVINIASVVAHAGYPMQSAYTASKHALLGFTKAFAQEVYKDNIRVHAISPGGVFTDMVKISRPDLTGDNMIMPEDIAEIVLFFIKNRGNAVIDEVILHRVNKEPFLV